MLVITSSWKKRVEKGNKGRNNYHEYHDATNGDESIPNAYDVNLKSTGKGAKKRRAEVVTEEEGESDESDDEDD